jgi:hypothetical protein
MKTSKKRLLGLIGFCRSENFVLISLNSDQSVESVFNGFHISNSGSVFMESCHSSRHSRSPLGIQRPHDGSARGERAE